MWNKIKSVGPKHINMMCLSQFVPVVRRAVVGQATIKFDKKSGNSRFSLVFLGLPHCFIFLKFWECLKSGCKLGLCVRHRFERNAAESWNTSTEKLSEICSFTQVRIFFGIITIIMYSVSSLWKILSLYKNINYKLAALQSIFRIWYLSKIENVGYIKTTGSVYCVHCSENIAQNR